VQLPSLSRDPDFSNLDPNDTIPSNIDPSTISYAGEFLPTTPAFFVSNPHVKVGFPDNGITVSLKVLQDWSPSDQEWVAVDTTLLRVNTFYMEHTRCPVYLNKTLLSTSQFWDVIGYDAAVCVQRYEPWIVETYNTPIASPSILRIVGKGNASTPLSPSGSIQGVSITDTRYLNTTGKEDLIYVAHQGTINQIRKDLGEAGDYQPPPAVGPVVLS